MKPLLLLCWLLSAARAEHAGPSKPPETAGSPVAKASLAKLLTLLETRLTDDEPLVVSLNRDAIPDETFVPAKAKSFTLSQDDLQVMRVRLRQIQEYLEKLKKHCGSSEEKDGASVHFAAYIENFLNKVAGGMRKTGDMDAVVISPARLGRFVGGISLYLSAQKPNGRPDYPDSADLALLEHARDLYSLFSESSDGDPADITEKPLRDVLDTFTDTGAKRCSFGVENPNQNYDVATTRVEFDEDKATVTSEDGKRVDRKLEIKAGEKFVLTLPIKELRKGIKAGQTLKAELYGAEPRLESKKVVYDKSAGKIEIHFETNPHLRGGRYDSLSFNYEDEIGSSQFLNVDRALTVILRPEVPDVTPPVLHPARAEAKVGDRVLKGPPYAVKTGEKVTFTIPVTDDLAGLPESYQKSAPSLDIIVGDSTYGHGGKYDAQKKALVYEIDFRDQPSGDYPIAYLPYVEDAAGNNVGRSIKDRFVFRLTNPKTDFAPPEVQVASFRWEDDVKPEKEFRPARNVEPRVSLIIHDADTGIERAELILRNLALEKSSTYISSESVDTKTGRTTFRVNYSGRFQITGVKVTDKAGNEREVPLDVPTVIYLRSPLASEQKISPKSKF